MQFAKFLSLAREQGVSSLTLDDGTVVSLSGTAVASTGPALAPLPEASGSSHKRRRRKFGRLPTHLKKEIKKRTHAGESQTAVAADLGVSAATVNRYASPTRARTKKLDVAT